MTVSVQWEMTGGRRHSYVWEEAGGGGRRVKEEGWVLQ